MDRHIDCEIDGKTLLNCVGDNIALVREVVRRIELALFSCATTTNDIKFRFACGQVPHEWSSGGASLVVAA